MDHKKLIIWQKGFDLSFAIYELTKKIPNNENYGLISQMRRSAVSVPSNISEGYGRFSKKYFHSFLKISLGSVLELETQILLCERIGYLNKKEIDPVLESIIEIRKIIGSIISK